MALTDAQKATLVTMTYKPLADIEAAATSLSAESEALIVEYIEVWQPIKNEHLILHGGRDGVDINDERSRRTIRRRVLVLLGLVATPPFFALASGSRGQ